MARVVGSGTAHTQDMGVSSNAGHFLIIETRNRRLTGMTRVPSGALAEIALAPSGGQEQMA